MANVNDVRRLVVDRFGSTKRRSAWDRGVQEYALELLEDMEEWGEDVPESYDKFNRYALNGAGDWSAYSWGGCSLVYDSDVAERLCTPSELRRTRYGERRPNGREEWLDTQARALYQASRRIWSAVRTLTR